ncbi:hypothetical protein N8940_01005 [Sphingomonadaceae bacterium]|nr:hypothetical protein [Sphingomonadaceae bacterium]
MRRSLVLTDDSARHPFLASLPPHIRAETRPVPARPKFWLTRDDIRSFFAAYVASLTAALIFIA